MSEIRYNAPNTILIDDEGVRLGSFNEIDFVGGGVTATLVGLKATITIPGGLAMLSINNTVFVDKSYGNDATGVCERMDKPFLTIAAARTAAVAFFVAGDAPSATNRILFKLQPGYYNEEPIVLLNFADWDLTDSVLNCVEAITIGDNGVAVDSIIYGNAKISGGILGTVVLSGEPSLVRIFCDSINGVGDNPPPP